MLEKKKKHELFACDDQHSSVLSHDSQTKRVQKKKKKRYQRIEPSITPRALNAMPWQILTTLHPFFWAMFYSVNKQALICIATPVLPERDTISHY